MSLLERMKQELAVLAGNGNLRQLPCIEHKGTKVMVEGVEMMNLSSNDYLGLASREDLRAEFLSQLNIDNFLPTSSSSRLLTGNFAHYERIENRLARMFEAESALIFNSGYHANMGILPAICSADTLLLADKLVHASIIDGIRLTNAKYIRYRHNDYTQLERLVENNVTKHKEIIIVTESIFSMDGDEADLTRLVALKKKYNNVMLYVDEAHAFGARGNKGLGLAEEHECIADIDFLVGTFGKALASTGAYIICKEVVRQYLINKMRTLIFTTALPPVCIAWSDFLLSKLSDFTNERYQLKMISNLLKEALVDKGYDCPSTSHIMPLIIGKSDATIKIAKELQRKGFYALPVRPPTVPEGTSRIRFSLSAALTEHEIKQLTDNLPTAF